MRRGLRDGASGSRPLSRTATQWATVLGSYPASAAAEYTTSEVVRLKDRRHWSSLGLG